MACRHDREGQLELCRGSLQALGPAVHDADRDDGTRGLVLAADEKDPYVNAMNALSRRGSRGYFLGRLLLAGIVEARGCERFGMVAEAPIEDDLKVFYQRIAQSEARHHQLFVALAEEYFPAAEVRARWDELLDREAEIVAGLPARAALH